MYTARIKRWGLKKNYLAEEKDILVAQITEALANGQSISSITLRGQHIKHHRVLRYWKVKVSEKDARLVTALPTRPALDSSILSDIEPDNRTNENLTVSVEPDHWTTSAPLTTHIAAYDTDMGLSSTIATRSNLVAASCCGTHDGPSPATISIPDFSIKASPGELILYATSSYLDSLGQIIPSMKSLHIQSSVLGLGSNKVSTVSAPDPSDASETNKFWHDFETAVYLLQIGSFTLGWSTFHATWEKAAEIVLSNPITLLRKLITTLTPGGKLSKFPEILSLILRFIADIVQLKLGQFHPFVHICQQLQLDDQSPKTSEMSLCLVRDMLERHLGTFHQETFHIHLGLIACQRLNRNLAAAEDSARSLLQKSQYSPQGIGQLPQALRKMTHVLKDLRRYDEAIAICHRILDHDVHAISNELAIYTREDVAELYMLQGQVSMESRYLSEALVASRQWFGHNAAPTLHIWDKLKKSLTEQGRESEALLWE